MGERRSAAELDGPRITVRVLGPVSAMRDETPVDLGGPRQRALLAALAAAYPHAPSADQLLAEVWSDAAEPSVNALHFAVSKLRRHLSPERDRGRPGAVVRHGAHYALRIAELDSARFERLVENARDVRSGAVPGTLDDAAALLNEALGLWRGDPFQDVDLDCVVPVRARLDGLRRDASSALVEIDLARGRTGEALRGAEALAERHPLDEHAWELLARALYRSGRQGDALAAIRRIRRTLDDELGVDPGAALQDLERRILAHEVDRRPIPEAGATPRSSAQELPRGRQLPSFRNRLVGRTADLAKVSDLLDSHALVTLFGPGGVGKTRLAVEAARRAESGEDAWFVDLSVVPQGSEVVVPVAQTLGFPSVASVEELAALIGERPLLLVLDNCEHLVAGAARLAETLLDHCPRTELLVTSRELLDVDGEVGYEVRPLDPESAVELFADRAVSFDPNWSATDTEAGVVRRICEGLDGLPLALELAAAQLCVLSTEQVAEGVGDRFTLLVGGRRFTRARHRSLVETVDWSYRMLDNATASVLRAVSVFAGSFDIDGVAAVLGEDDRLRAVEPVRALIRRSLLMVVPDTTPKRYQLLKTIKDFGAQQSTPDERDRFTVMHRNYVVRKARCLASELRGPGARRAVAELVADRAEHRAVLAAALEQDDPHYVLELAGHLYWFWYRKANVSEGLYFLRAALERVEGHPVAPEPLYVGRGLMGMALLTDLTGDSEAAREYSDRAGEVLLATCDEVEIAHANYLRAYYRTACGDHDSAVKIVQRSLSHLQQSATAWLEASFLMVRGLAQQGRGDASAAKTLGHAAEVARRCGYQWALICSLWASAKAAASHRDHHRALELVRELVPILETDSEVTGWIVTTHTAAAALAGLGRHADAARVLAASRAHGERVGMSADLLDPYNEEEAAAIAEASRSDDFAECRDEGAHMSREAVNAMIME